LRSKSSDRAITPVPQTSLKIATTEETIPAVLILEIN
jgi:hypothetical protein